MSKFNDIPKFGPLSGVRVVVQAGSIAGPCVGMLSGDFGADVIWVEQSKMFDLSRNADGLAVQQNHRNQRSIGIDIVGKGRQAFLDIVATADILVEANKGGTYEKWGLTDEFLWERNPKLVIVHISGFGQTGLPDYVSRASYDTVAQCFSGFAYLNTPKDQKPYLPVPMVADWYTGMFAFGSAMSALFNAERTGKGESIDVAQYEVMLRMVDENLITAWNHPEHAHHTIPTASFNSGNAGYDFYKCLDGKFVLIVGVGSSVPKLVNLIGGTFGSEEFPKAFVYHSSTEAGKRFDEGIKGWCAARTSTEVLAKMDELAIASTLFSEPEDILNNPHVQARESIIKLPWLKDENQMVDVCGFVPKFKNNPIRFWRSAPSWGGDTRDILEDVGYTTEQIDELYEAGVITTSPLKHVL